MLNLSEVKATEPHWWLVTDLLVKIGSGKCLGAIRHQGITWNNVDPDPCCQMASPGLKWIDSFSPMMTIFYVFRWNQYKMHFTKSKYFKFIPKSVFYLKFFEHPSFGQVGHEIYPSEWKVHPSEISITIMYCWYMFLMAVATDLTHVTILI